MKTCHMYACRRVLFISAALVLAIAGVRAAPVGAQGRAPAPSGEAEVLSAGDAGAPIRLRTGVFFPAAGQKSANPADLTVERLPTAGLGYYIVQFTGPVREAWKERVTKAGGTIFDYIPDFAFVVRMDDAAHTAVTALPEVAWVGPFQPAYKLSPDFAGRTGMLDLVIQTFPDTALTDLSGQMAASGGWVADASASEAGGLLRVQADAAQLEALAKIPGVRWIEPFYERVLFNDVARGNAILGAESAWSSLGLYGQGQIVAVADTGLDTGSLGTLHQDFLGNPTGCSNTSRIVATYALGRVGDWGDSCYSGANKGGHGTHVSGSVLGNGCWSGSTGLPGYAGSYAGLAPQAGLVMQSVMDSSCGLGGLPIDLNSLFSQARSAGARIHTNSWGAAVAGQYTTDSRNTDLFTWNNKDATILFSAGNAGIDANSDGFIDLDSIGAPATAKNAITVGASENNRATGGYNPGGACSTWGGCWPSRYPAEPIKSDPLSNNSAGIVAFSSRGPTDDGRIKPDVVAPGSNVLSTKSQATYVSGGWGAGPTQYYQYMGGTSMSTPLTAGAMALIRQFYTDMKGITPSGALLKATVINSATDLYPGQYASPLEHNPRLPNFAQGWGRVNVANATDNTHAWQDIADAGGLATGGSQSYAYESCGASTFKVTLVWTDYPGATLAARELVNDLDLGITAPDGATAYRGNVFSNGWSAAGGSADRTNNVESVYLQAPAAGVWTITVSGYNVPNGSGGKQGYALVVDRPGFTGCNDFTVNTTPTALNVCAPDDAIFSVNVGQLGGFSGVVTLGASDNPAGTTASFSANPVTPPGSSTLTIGNTGAAAAGSYNITVTGTAGATSQNNTVRLDLSTALPAAPVLVAPAYGATGVPAAPTFSWNAAAGATGYALEIATDPVFVNIVHTASGPTATSYTLPAALSSGTTYFWRVRAENACGSRTTPSRFTTAATSADCAAGMTANVLLSEGFEGGADGWTHSGAGDTWAIWGTEVHGGSAAFHANTPDTPSDQRLVSPAVAVPASQLPVSLRFWNRQVMESHAAGCYDGGLLEVTTDGGTTWTQVTSGLLTDPYNGPISASWGNPLANLDAWCGNPQDWLNSIVDLGAVAGETIKLGFRAGTDTGVSLEGWSIDDVTVQSCQPCAAPAAPAGLTIARGSGGQVQLAWGATADAAYYEVWWSAGEPYFMPGADCGAPGPYGCAYVTGTNFTAASLGSPASHTVYAVRAASSCGAVSAPAAVRVGEFVFALE